MHYADMVDFMDYVTDPTKLPTGLSRVSAKTLRFNNMYINTPMYTVYVSARGTADRHGVHRRRGGKIIINSGLRLYSA